MEISNVDLLRRIEDLEAQMQQVRDGTIVGKITGVDKVDGIHAATTATASKLLALNSSSKLPASITGDANTVDDKHATDLCGVINWLATTVTKTGGTDYTTDGAWTGLDLTSATSANAKYVILLLQHTTDCTASDILCVRENGKTPDAYPVCRAQVTSQCAENLAIIKMDTNQVIEYYATDASDTLIYVLGYIE